MYKCVWLVEGGHGKNMSEENCQHINSGVGYIKHVVNHVLSAFCEHLHTGQIRQIMYVVHTGYRQILLLNHIRYLSLGFCKGTTQICTHAPTFTIR